MAEGVRARAQMGWLLSFGDTVTLLITFFIMMLALNYGAISRVQKWVDDTLAETHAFLQAEVRSRGLTYFRILRDPRGVLIRINNSDAFESGSAVPSASLREQLSELGYVLRLMPLLSVQETAAGRRIVLRAREYGQVWQVNIEVEGHTDADPIAPTSPLRDNWILSALRAERVADRLQKTSLLPRPLFSIVGYGDTRPLAPNDTPAHKALNRRIDIVISAQFVSEAQAAKNRVVKKSGTPSAEAETPVSNK
ncbi:chemotaxis protein MotB [Sulfurivirga caldicuralii]|uniref:Chemotaxis protein MotB n=1 Tax=Sulfurivirga caldicuralii TaxID=364032 RepID=A0A1N6GKM4_9GAMM|nr:flagellar motor protein MotB [Sulfurivirga caldicuralii]SIO08083.1 chemotaxis protein MotB [Sulfurivirga caldicuralii]